MNFQGAAACFYWLKGSSQACVRGCGRFYPKNHHSACPRLRRAYLKDHLKHKSAVAIDLILRSFQVRFHDLQEIIHHIFIREDGLGKRIASAAFSAEAAGEFLNDLAALHLAFSRMGQEHGQR